MVKIALFCASGSEEVETIVAADLMRKSRFGFIL